MAQDLSLKLKIAADGTVAVEHLHQVATGAGVDRGQGWVAPATAGPS